VRRLWALFHDTFEGDADYPVVRHVFLGKTPEEAQAIYDRHRSTDAFLRAADDAGRMGEAVLTTEYELMEVDFVPATHEGRLAVEAIDGDAGAGPEVEEAG